MSLTERPYLSIGEVLGLLLEEFPDVTISKIRFLESQGLIDPERTPSGYRKFYDVDVERLRVILREQRENFLPLKVIRHRLENGQIDDPSGALTPPRGIRNVVPTALAAVGDDTAETAATVTPAGTDSAADSDAAAGDVIAGVLEDLAMVGGSAAAAATGEGFAVGELSPVAAVRDPTPVAQMAPLEVADSTSVSAAELCARSGLTADQLQQLQSYGILVARPASGSYQPTEVDIATACAGFLRHGVEPRHLRGWRQAVDRESALFEQMVMPYLRQRNPASRQQAVAMLEDLAQLGGELRAALLHAALQHHLDR